MEHKSTFMILLIFTILVGWTGASAVAEMVIIDFENLSDGQNIHNMNLGGVTLSIPGTHGQRGPYVDTPRYDPGNVFFDYQYSRILRTPDGSDDIVGVFDIPVTTVSIEVGRYHDYDKFPPPGGDSDLWGWLWAYDENGVKVDTFLLNLPAYSYDLYEFSVSAPSIASFSLTTDENSYADNLTFEVIPEPATLILLSLGVVMVRRKRRMLLRQN